MHTTTLADYATVGRNLQPAGYTRVTFQIRGSLSTHTFLKIEVASPGAPGNACAFVNSPCLTLSADGKAADDACTADSHFPNGFAMTPKALTASWQPYSINVPVSVPGQYPGFL